MRLSMINGGGGRKLLLTEVKIRNFSKWYQKGRNGEDGITKKCLILVTNVEGSERRKM